MNDDSTAEKPRREAVYLQLEKDALDIINMKYETQYRSLTEIDLAEILNTPPKHT